MLILILKALWINSHQTIHWTLRRIQTLYGYCFKFSSRKQQHVLHVTRVQASIDRHVIVLITIFLPIVSN